MELWSFMEGGGKRAVAVWHRRAGKDLMAINWIATAAMQRVGLYWHLLPTYNQGRKIVWDGYTRDGRPFLDAFPKELIQSKNNTEMRITLKSPNPEYDRGSVYQVVGTDDVNKLVGTNPIGCVFSEYSLHDPRAWDYIRPILAENGGWAVFIYTARGRNHGWKLLEMAKKNPKWFAEVLVAGNDGTKRPDGTPVIGDEIIEEERAAGMEEELIQSEFYCSFDAPVIGSYYGKQMELMRKQKRIRNLPVDTMLDVHTAWDLGVGDTTAIVFFQVHGLEVRIVDFYEQSGEGLSHYVNVLNERGYRYGKHFAPWDIEVRELGTGKSRKETAREMGIRFTTVKKLPVVDGIEAVRNLLSRVYIDETQCDLLIEALRQYRKEWDDKNRCYKPNPLHDWTSHPCDAMRTLAVGLRKNFGKKKKRVYTQAQIDYDVFSVT